MDSRYRRLSIILPKNITEEENFPQNLRDLFRYNRKEFISAAHANDITVPENLLDYESENIVPFVERRGPRYLFQMMFSNPERSTFVRSALSLLTVTIAMLWGKVPIGDKAMWEKHRDSVTMELWAATSLNMIADASSVIICIEILIVTKEQTIQALVLELLSQLISVSDEALHQMLETPMVDKVDDCGRLDGNIDSSESSLPKTITPIAKRNSDSRKAEVALFLFRNNFSTRGVDDEPKILILKPGVSLLTSPATRGPRHRSKVTCLSYMITVAGRHRNHHAVMEGCAAVILAMLSNSSSVSMSIAEIIASTPTCDLHHHPSNTNSDNKTKQHRPRRDTTGNVFQIRPKTAATKDANNNTKSKKQSIVEWSGVKLLIQFLQRFSRYTVGPNADMEWGRVAAPPSQRKSLMKAHRRVLHALCELVALSPVIAAYVVSELPEAIQTILDCKELFIGVRNEVSKAFYRCERTLDAVNYELQEKQAHEKDIQDRRTILRRISSARHIARQGVKEEVEEVVIANRPNTANRKPDNDWGNSDYIWGEGYAGNGNGNGNGGSGVRRYSAHSEKYLKEGFYSVKEYPSRRGLRQSQASDESLYRDFFNKLPESPTPPQLTSSTAIGSKSGLEISFNSSFNGNSKINDNNPLYAEERVLSKLQRVENKLQLERECSVSSQRKC
eukprot:gene3739-7422_t